MSERLLSRNRISHLANYDPATGNFTWNNVSGYRMKRGDPMGSLSPNGYLQLRIDGRQYSAHRIAWFLVYGKWPKHQLDHINGIRIDNRICNLREATNSQNALNTRVRIDNASGHRGVGWHRRMNKWTARLMVDRKQIWLGSFDKKDDAVRAYRKAAQLHFGEFVRNV